MDAQTTPSDPRLVCNGCGDIHSWARLVDLPDGRVVGNCSEDYRRYCEAVWLLKKKRSKRTRIEYLDEIQKIRGVQARIDLRDEMMKIWELKKEQQA